MLHCTVRMYTEATSATCDARFGTCSEESALLQRPLSGNALADRKEVGLTNSTRLGNREKVPRSVYFLPVDRFGKHGWTHNATACDNDNDWCNGTIRGVTDHLDYIQHMGFEAIWITPVVKQWPGRSPSGTGCMGYWAYNIYEIDPHFGTSQDLKDLVQELHRRDMVIIYDFVGNHMGPIHNEEMVREMYPFNETRYFNQLFRGNLTFNEYVNRTSDWPPPAQAMWSQSGAQCTQGMDCSCYKCKENDDLGIIGDRDPFGPCQGIMVHNPASPCPANALSKYCMPGDLECQGYNATVTHRGWFYDLGDLNQTDPFVRQTQLDWIKWFVTEYDIDYLRLDTAPFMAFDFLSELQESANVSIFGEVTTTNLTFHAQFQHNPPTPHGDTVLDGVLNFPLYYSALAGFCGEWWPYSQWNLTFLGERMTAQQETPYRNLDQLGNFIDNHDTPRLSNVCNSDWGRVANAITWTMLTKGMPIIYYGTEELLTSVRDSLWQYGYNTRSKGFNFIKVLNEIRSTIPTTATLTTLPTRDHGTLVFARADTHFIFLNNLPNSTSTVDYCGIELPELKAGYEWRNVITGHEAHVRNDCVLATSTVPLVMTQVQIERVEKLTA